MHIGTRDDLHACGRTLQFWNSGTYLIVQVHGQKPFTTSARNTSSGKLVDSIEKRIPPFFLELRYTIPVMFKEVVCIAGGQINIQICNSPTYPYRYSFNFHSGSERRPEGTGNYDSLGIESRMCRLSSVERWTSTEDVNHL